MTGAQEAAMNEIASLLIELGLSDPSSIVPYFDRVRDRDDIGVLRCRRSGVILLDRCSHITPEHYDGGQEDLTYWAVEHREQGLRKTREDDERRARIMRDLVANRRWLDVGTGLGGVLDLLRGEAGEISAVEVQPGPRRALRALGYVVHAALDEVPDASVDVATLFHVFEHIRDPLGFLATLKRKLVPGGLVCIEVPHARDALLTQYDCLPFRRFTLWSEHLILHTRASLGRFLSVAGYGEADIQGIQRYPLANHLHWLARGAPGGHVAWHHLRGDGLDQAYESRLAALDMTDTLIAWARVPR